MYGRLAFAAVALWAIAYITGSRLPYFYTEFGFAVRAYVFFPFFLAAYSYVAFIYKKEGGETGYRKVIKRMPRTGSVIFTFIVVAGMVLIFGSLAGSLAVFSAWATELTAATRFSQTYKVSAINAFGGPVWSTKFDLTLIPEGGTGAVDLRLTRSRYNKHRWEAGDIICVEGRTSIFGSIADSTTRGDCHKK